MCTPFDSFVAVKPDGRAEFTYVYEDNYVGSSPSYLWFPVMEDPWSRCVQEYCYKHGTDVTLVGSFKNIMVTLGVYRLDKNIVRLGGRDHYHLFRWKDMVEP